MSAEPEFQEIEEAEFTVEEETPAVALMAHEDYVPRPALPAAELIARREELEHMIETTLTPKIDFGIIPNTGGKPSLLKPGGEKIAFWFGWEITFPLDRQRKVEDIAEGFFFYTYTCVLVDKSTGREVGECEGSANSKEKRFATYKNGGERNPFDQINSLQKMGQKRAMVGAILFAAALSNRFTQDVEDMDITGGEPFGLDVVVSFGKHSGATWRQIATDHPDYVVWAIGRGNGDGMDKLDADARKVLGEYLDSLADVSDGLDKAKESAAKGDIHALTSTECPNKKHKGKTWAKVLEEDADYCRWCVDNGKVHGRVKRALENALAAPAESEPDPDAPFDLNAERANYGEGRWEDLYVHLCEQWEIQPEGEEAYASVHPQQPDKFKDWKEPNYKLACTEFYKHGARDTIARAIEVWEARERGEEPPEKDTLPVKLTALFGSVSKRALALEVITVEEIEEGQKLVDAADRAAVEALIDVWQSAVFAKAGGPPDG